MKYQHPLQQSLVYLTLLIGCGDRNAFAPLTPPTPAEKAAMFLEKENPDAAIETILNTLGDTYQALYKAVTTGTNNETQLHTEMEALIADDSIDNVPNLISLLSSAQAQKYNVDPFAMVLQLAKSQTPATTTLVDTTASHSLGSLTQLYPILPRPTSDNIKGLQAALFILRSIGGPNSTKSDHLKLGLFLTANLVLELKLIDTNEDGSISTEEALQISETAATSFLSTIEAAVASILSSDLSNSKASSASDKLTKLQTTLQTQSGSDNAEKLRSFFAQAQSK